MVVQLQTELVDILIGRWIFCRQSPFALGQQSEELEIEFWLQVLCYYHAVEKTVPTKHGAIIYHHLLVIIQTTKWQPVLLHPRTLLC